MYCLQEAIIFQVNYVVKDQSLNFFRILAYRINALKTRMSLNLMILNENDRNLLLIQAMYNNSDRYWSASPHFAFNPKSRQKSSVFAN